MDKLKLGFLVRGNWEASQGNREAAIAAYKVVGDHPLAKSLIAYASDDQPLEYVIEAYRDAIDCGAEDLLITYRDLITLFNPDDERLASITTRIDLGIANKNPRIIAGLFRDRMSARDFAGAARACSDAVALRDAQTMSNLAEILMRVEGLEEFIYHLSDKELFNPQPWPVPIVVSVPESKMWTLSGEYETDPIKQQTAIQEDAKALEDFHAFLTSLFDQGEETPLFLAGRLRAILAMSKNTDWASRMVDLFANRPEESRAFWSDPDLILFYTEKLIAENLHFEIEWIRTGISQYGLEDVFDRVVEMALLSEARKHTEETRSAGSMQPHVYIDDKEITIYEAFNQAAKGSPALIERIAANPYLQIFHEGRLVDLKSILTQDVKLACLGAESHFRTLSDFFVLANIYESNGFIDLIEPCLRYIEQTEDASQHFLTMLGESWLDFGTTNFQEGFNSALLPLVILNHPNSPSSLGKLISVHFPVELSIRNLYASIGDFVMRLQDGENVIQELTSAITKGTDNQDSGFNSEIWSGEEIREDIWSALEEHEALWQRELIDLARAISRIDDHFLCVLVQIDSVRETPFFSEADLHLFSETEYCDDQYCEGPRALSGQHPNFS